MHWLSAEEEISFPPTYRYERGSRDTYVWQKQKATGVRFKTQTPSQTDLHPGVSSHAPSFCEVVW